MKNIHNPINRTGKSNVKIMSKKEHKQEHNPLKEKLIGMDLTEENLDLFDEIVAERQRKFDLMDRFVLTMIVTLILGVLIIIGLFFNK